jgi:prophage DNA circulation protein
MADNRLHPFASPQWTTIPFESHPKLIFDNLVDVLFAVLRCLSSANHLIASDANNAHELQAELSKLIQSARIQIHEWKSEALFYVSLKEDQSPSVSESEDDVITSLDSRHFMLPYTDIPSAALVSLYDAANIIVLRLLHLVSPTASLYDARIQQHTQSILSAHEMISEKSSPEPGRGSIMMVQQLKIAALWSSSSQQRAAAVNMLQGFRKGGFAGISAPSHEYFADVAAYILRKYSVEGT